jgi:hypothetical protein
MEQSVTIKYCWTADELLMAYRYHFRHTCRPVFRFGLHTIFALMLVAGIAGIIKGGDRFLATSIALVAAGIYWFAVRPFERRWMIRRQFAKRPDKNIELEWHVTSDQIQTRNCLGHSEFSWQAITKLVQAPTGIMLYPNDQIFHWLPRHGFASDADFKEFIDLAKTKVQRHYNVA